MPRPYASRAINYHPVVRMVLGLVAESPLSDHDIAYRAGIGKNYLIEMRRGNVQSPRLVDLEAVLGVFHKRIVIEDE